MAYVFAANFEQVEGSFCRDCAQHVGRRSQNRTLLFGWWGILSFFRNLAYVFGNAKQLRTIGQLATPTTPISDDPPDPNRRPVRQTSGAPLDPGRPVFLRPGAILSIAVFCVVAYFAATSDGLARWEVGSCVKGELETEVEVVHCTDDHDGKITHEVDVLSECPASTDGWVEERGKVLCIDVDQ
jgi:hypothetical protein